MRLYALCDQDLLDKKALSLEDFVAIAKRYDAEIVQYRCKNGSLAEIKNGLIKLRKIYDGFLIVNDHYELTSFCDGVHIGQEDLLRIDSHKVKAVEILKKVIGEEKIIGLSTHNEAEVLEANHLALNYIGLGPYRATATKKDAQSPLGASLDSIAKQSVHFVAAIGGVLPSDKFEYVTYHVIGSGLLR